MSRCRYIKKIKNSFHKKNYFIFKKRIHCRTKKRHIKEGKNWKQQQTFFFFSSFHFFYSLSLYLICEHKRQASKRAKNDVAKEITSISACHCLRYFADFISALLVTVFSFSSFFNSYFYFFSFPSCFH